MSSSGVPTFRVVLASRLTVARSLTDAGNFIWLNKILALRQFHFCQRCGKSVWLLARLWAIPALLALQHHRASEVTVVVDRPGPSVYGDQA